MKTLDNNIQESFCSSEVRKLLETKGCTLGEHMDGLITHTLAIEWIRVNFGIWVNVYQAFQFNEGREDYLKSRGFIPNITMTKDGVFQSLPDSVIDEYYIEPYHKTPQEATEFALKYVLEDLI